MSGGVSATAADVDPSWTPQFESMPLVKPTGFREYDARWWFGHPAPTSRPSST